MEKRERQTYKVESIMIKKRFSWKTEKLQNLNDEILLVVDNTNKEWKGHVLNVIDLLNSLAEENEQLKQQIKIKKKWQLEKDRYYVDLHKKYDKLEKENERLKEKLNVTALELVDEAISMGKAVEISEMNYHEFLEYRKKKGKAMELQR